MKNKTEELSPAGRQYHAAYMAHYSDKDVSQALTGYGELVASHPDSKEAADARSQIHNIARSVVPAQEMVDSDMSLARTHLAHLAAEAVAV